jgi:lysophospholipase L1-like esterase
MRSLLFAIIPMTICCSLSSAAESQTAQSCEPIQTIPNTTPAPEQSPHFLLMALKSLSVAPANAQIVLLGDSIANGWALSSARDFPNVSVGNLGVNSDRTQHVLWRLQQPSPIFQSKPRAILLILGTNNWSEASTKPCGVVAGLDAVVKRVNALWPNAVVFVFPVLPAGVKSREDDRKQVNTALEGLFAASKNVIFVPVNEVEFACIKDGVRPSVCANYKGDGLHLEPPGYSMLARYARDASVKKLGYDALK